VDEKDIQMVQLDRHTQIATSALPGVASDCTIDSINPQAVPKEGSNSFEVYAKFVDPPSSDWRPGMQGEAKIDTVPKPLIWWGTHRLFDWLRLKMWM
jgi:hypothetical protein